VRAALTTIVVRPYVSFAKLCFAECYSGTQSTGRTVARSTFRLQIPEE